MTITQITVSAGRTFNDPYEQYSNYKPYLTLTATLEDDDHRDECIEMLQAKAERLMDSHKRKMLSDLRALQAASQIRQEVSDLEAKITRFQERLEAIKHNAPELPLYQDEDIPL
jgi:ABC-type phosphate transport system auxiliary subunit